MQLNAVSCHALQYFAQSIHLKEILQTHENLANLRKIRRITKEKII